MLQKMLTSLKGALMPVTLTEVFFGKGAQKTTSVLGRG
jgi:ATP:corrinoid adenosyltransferase